MKNQNISIPIIMALAMIFAMAFVSAVSTLDTPVTGGNYTKSLTVSLTVAQFGLPGNATNVTCFYNASGGSTEKGTVLVAIANTTAAQTAWSSTATLTTETSTYNVSCRISNVTTVNTTLYASGITIDGTNPVVSITRDVPQISQKGLENLVWSSTDTNLYTTAVSVVSPDTSLCPTLSYTDAVSSRQLINQQTQCAGTYTATITGTDYSGNSATDSTTWIVNIPDGKFMGASSNVGANYPGKASSTNWILIIVVIIIALLIWKGNK